MKLTDLPGTKSGHRKRNIALATVYGYCILVWVGGAVFMAVNGGGESTDSSPYENAVIVECDCQWNGNLATDHDNEPIAAFGKEVHSFDGNNTELIVSVVKENYPYESLTVTVYDEGEKVATEENDDADSPVVVYINNGSQEEPPVPDIGL